jgi:hypothetical protein
MLAAARLHEASSASSLERSASSGSTESSSALDVYNEIPLATLAFATDSIMSIEKADGNKRFAQVALPTLDQEAQVFGLNK